MMERTVVVLPMPPLPEVTTTILVIKKILLYYENGVQAFGLAQQP
jgi:hypothetical protein